MLCGMSKEKTSATPELSHLNNHKHIMSSFVGDLWKKVGELKDKYNTIGSLTKTNSSFPFVFDENKPTGCVIGPFKQFEGKEFETPGKEESIFRRISLFSCKDVGRIEEAKRIVKGLKTLKHPRILGYVSSKETENQVLLVTEWAEPFKSHGRKNDSEWETWAHWSVQQVYEFLRESRCISVSGDSGNLWITAAGEVKVAIFNDSSNEVDDDISAVMRRTFPNGKIVEKNDLIQLTESFDYLVTFSSGERVNLIKRLSNFGNNRFLKFLALPELIRTRKLVGSVTGAGQQEVAIEEVHFLFVKGKDLLKLQNQNHVDTSLEDFMFLLSDLYCELLGKHTTNTIPLTICLLDQMGSRGLCELFPEKYAQDKIYPHVSSLLCHPMPAMREAAVKALECLCAKLSPKTLGNDVLRQLARLQGDVEGVLRLKAVEMLSGPLWPKLPDTLKSKICGPAVARALSDTFTPCRRSGLNLLRQGLPLLSPIEIATKVIPAVAGLLIEEDAMVRGEAFECMEKLILPTLKKSAKAKNVMAEKSVSSPIIKEKNISTTNNSNSNSNNNNILKTCNVSELEVGTNSSVTSSSELQKSSTSGSKMKLGSIKKII